MRIIIKGTCLFFIFLFPFVIGCGFKIPQLKNSAETERTFNAPFDKTWNSVIEVVRLSNAKIITEDINSGLIVCTVPVRIMINPYSDSKQYSEGIAKLHMIESRAYMSIFVKKSEPSGQTAVYLAPRFRYGPYMKEIDREFFKKLIAKLGE